MTDLPATYELDLTRAPRGEVAASQLVQAVATQVDFAERHYLEIKGPDDLTSKRNKHKIAKFILGAANRMPKKAAEAFEGCAVMVIGITNEGIIGVPPIEMLELTQVIEKFTGVDGPSWDVVRVPVPDSTNQVLLIIVEPPKQGQSPFICRADGESLTDGATYIRADGETRQAKSRELDQLKAREAPAIQTLPVDLDIGVVGKVLPLTVDDSRTLNEYIARTRKRLLDALENNKRSLETNEKPRARYNPMNQTANKILEHIGSIAQYSTGDSIPESRDEQQYLDEIKKWEEDFQATWTDIITQVASHCFNPAEIRVRNRTQTYIYDLHVDLHLEGNVESIDYFERRNIKRGDIDMPRPPRRWGPKQRYLPTSYLSPMSRIPNLSNSLHAGTSRSTWRNTNSVHVSVEVGDLRPEAEFVTDDESSILVIFDEEPKTIKGTWTATTRGYNEVFKGELVVEVEDTYDLTEPLRNFLQLNNSDGSGGSDKE